MSDSIVDPHEHAQSELEDPLDALVAQCLDSGEADLHSAVETTCRAHPEHASEIRRRVSALRAAGLLRAHGVEREAPFPERLGDFRLLERLGGGGMGVVFRARQETLGREVALKLIRPEHMYFPRARERFRRETEAVARLQHPGIVPIYTVGDAQGLPYFAMELVAGSTLGEIVKDLEGRAPESLRGRDLREALQRTSASKADANVGAHSKLFDGSWVEACLSVAIQVARALHHAHGRGVLHRDVKPSNIALTFDGRAMLLDFGLASLEAEARMTQQGSAMGSLLYMAPEQVRGDTAEVDARSDVYALGVTLYELLTLQAPYHDTNAISTRQAILEGRADSIRVRNRAVSRDLETVCFKAMERDATRRYANAEAFARDLENVLELRPIAARPPSTSLRARRWVQRNPAKSVALTLGCLLVLVTPSVFLWQQLSHNRDLAQERDRAQLEARESDAVAQFMVELFRGADPARARGRELTALELLDEGVARIERELTDQPELQARLMTRMGDTYASLGRYQSALPLLERSLELRTELFGERSLPVAEVLYSLSSVQYSLGDKRALETARRALELRETLDPERNVDLARYVVALANATARTGDHQAALPLYARAAEIQEELPSNLREFSELRELILTNQASALNSVGEHARAVECASEAAAIQRELFDGKPHPGVLANLSTLVLALKGLARFDEAREACDEMLELTRVLHGQESDPFAVGLMNKASLLDELGDAAGACTLYERALALYDRGAATGMPQHIACITNLARASLRTHAYPRARELYLEAMPLIESSYGEGNVRVVQVQLGLGLCDEAVGDLAAAEEAMRIALAAALAAQDSNRDLRLARVRANLARVLVREGEHLAAESELADALVFIATEADNAAVVALVRFAQASVDGAAAGSPEARATFRALAELAEEPKDAEWVPAAARARAAALTPDGEFAQPDLRQLVDAAERLAALLGPAHPETRDAIELATRRALAGNDADSSARLERLRDSR